MDKLNFLKNDFPQLLKTLKPDTTGNWGVLTAQGMIEHMAESISIATGKNNQKLHTPIEMVEKFQSFAMSDKEFKPNTKNALMPATAPPLLKNTIEEATEWLKQEILNFEKYFQENKGAKLMNPFFGELDFNQWVHLFYKHAVHHCKQFGLL